MTRRGDAAAPGMGERSSAAFHDATRAAASVPGRFSLVYESKDGRLCLFEDAAGHLTAVPASKLAG